MAGYVIIQSEIIDIERFKKYLDESPGIIAKYDGKYLARGGRTVVFEGYEEDTRFVIIEFPSLERAEEWYYSKEFQTIRALREGSVVGSIVAVEGY